MCFVILNHRITLRSQQTSPSEHSKRNLQRSKSTQLALTIAKFCMFMIWMLKMRRKKVAYKNINSKMHTFHVNLFENGGHKLGTCFISLFDQFMVPAYIFCLRIIIIIHQFRFTAREIVSMFCVPLFSNKLLCSSQKEKLRKSICCALFNCHHF